MRGPDVTPALKQRDPRAPCSLFLRVRLVRARASRVLHMWSERPNGAE